MTIRASAGTVVAIAIVAGALTACDDAAETSRTKAAEHVTWLVEKTESDVAEVRKGLPKGADAVAARWQKKLPADAGAGDAGAKQATPTLSVTDSRAILERARADVQDLRVAKSTFFALAHPEGRVISGAEEPDRLAGEDLFEAFPALAGAKTKYVETRGSLRAARGVEGRPDGQWVAGAPVRASGELLGLYVTGWAWSSYAYRLETALRSDLKTAAQKPEAKGKVPLAYVFVLVGKDVFASRLTPAVNADELKKRDALSKATGKGAHSEKLEITGREYGLAVQRAPALGEDVAIAVLRSEI